MAYESGFGVSLGYIEEVTPGTTPAGTFKTLRATQRAPVGAKDMLESQEVRASAQESDVRHGYNRAEGSVGFQLSSEDYDDLLAYSMRGTWATISLSGVDIGATNPSTYTRASGSFITDGYRVGDLLKVTGFVNGVNNVDGNARITAVAALSLTISGVTLITESAAAGRTIAVKGKRLDYGKLMKHISLERKFEAIAQYELFKGMTPQSWSLQMAANTIVNGSFNFLGISFAAMSGSSASTGAYSAPPNKVPFAIMDGELLKGGTAFGSCTELSFNANNNRQGTGVYGSKFTPAIFEGVARLTGNFTALLDGPGIVNDFINETEVNVWAKLVDPTGAFMQFNFHRLKFEAAPIDPPQDGPVLVAGTFRALEHGTYGTILSVQRSNT